MPKEFTARRLDVRALAEAGAELSGTDTVGNHERLAAETQGRGLDEPLAWHVRGEVRNPQHVRPDVWMHVTADTRLSLTCQRCLTPVETPVSIDRWFRFVADEATADAEDDESEEDLLVLSRQFDLGSLIEDELLMDMPLVPRHEVCPVPVSLGSDEPEEDEPQRPNPFAVLGKLKGGPGQ